MSAQKPTTDPVIRWAQTTRAQASKATPGPWASIALERDADEKHPKLGPKRRYVIGSGRYGPVIASLCRGLKHPQSFEADASLIAAHDPQIALAVAGVVEAAEKRRQTRKDPDVTVYDYDDAEDAEDAALAAFRALLVERAE